MSTCSSRSSGLRRRGLLACAILGGPALAAPQRAFEPFTPLTWAALQAEVDRQQHATLVLLSAGWCAVCPDLLGQLARDPRRRRARVPLWLVLTDGEPAERRAHHALADRLFAFDGPEAAIRHSIHPQWRGVVPHVALLRPGQAPQFVTGEPDGATLSRWLVPGVKQR